MALPPPTVGYAPVRRTVAPPGDRDAALPEADQVQQVLADALSSGLPRAGGPTSWRTGVGGPEITV